MLTSTQQSWISIRGGGLSLSELTEGLVALERPSGSLVQGRRWYGSGGDILLFVAISLAMALVIGQEQIILKGDPWYWALVMPAILFPTLRLRQTLENLVFGTARPLLMFGMLACGWFVIRHDFGAVFPALLFVWVAGWATRTEVRLHRGHLLALTLGFYCVACVLYLVQPDLRGTAWLNVRVEAPRAAFVAEDNRASIAPVVRPQSAPIALPVQQRDGLNLNAWGILPGQTAPAFQPWRVSATPNIATSGVFSLFILIIVFSQMEFRILSTVTLISTSYFVVLSFVRAVFAGLGLFFVSLSLMKALPNVAWLRVAVAFVLTAGIILFVAFSPVVLFWLQDSEVMSRLFLRGQTNMSIADIARQEYRPWLWGEHLKLFWSSPFLMGLGSELSATANSHIINEGQARSDSVSLLTRLLATYGMATVGIFWFFCECCYRHAKNNDTWAVAALVVMTFLMMVWGSVFHPTNGIFVLSFLIIARGRAAFAADDQ